MRVEHATTGRKPQICCRIWQSDAFNVNYLPFRGGKHFPTTGSQEPGNLPIATRLVKKCLPSDHLLLSVVQ